MVRRDWQSFESVACSWAAPLANGETALWQQPAGLGQGSGEYELHGVDRRSGHSPADGLYCIGSNTIENSSCHMQDLSHSSARCAPLHPQHSCLHHYVNGSWGVDRAHFGDRYTAATARLPCLVLVTGFLECPLIIVATPTGSDHRRLSELSIRPRAVWKPRPWPIYLHDCICHVRADQASGLAVASPGRASRSETRRLCNAEEGQLHSGHARCRRWSRSGTGPATRS